MEKTLDIIKGHTMLTRENAIASIIAADPTQNFPVMASSDVELLINQIYDEHEAQMKAKDEEIRELEEAMKPKTCKHYAGEDKKVKNMQQFKVGDWVTLLDKGIYQIKAISKDSTKLFLDTKESPHADNWWNITQCKLWQPQPGEWCWFWNNIAPDRPTLRKYLDSEQESFENCAPFCTKLPSF